MDSSRNGNCMVARATYIGEWGSLWTVSKEAIKNSKEELKFSELLVVGTVDPVPLQVDIIPEVSRAERTLLFVVESGDDFKITSVSEWKLLVTGFLCSRW